MDFARVCRVLLGVAFAVGSVFATDSDEIRASEAKLDSMIEMSLRVKACPVSVCGHVLFNQAEAEELARSCGEPEDKFRIDVYHDGTATSVYTNHAGLAETVGITVDPSKHLRIGVLRVEDDRSPWLSWGYLSLNFDPENRQAWDLLRSGENLLVYSEGAYRCAEPAPFGLNVASLLGWNERKENGDRQPRRIVRVWQTSTYGWQVLVHELRDFGDSVQSRLALAKPILPGEDRVSERVLGFLGEHYPNCELSFFDQGVACELPLARAQIDWSAILRRLDEIGVVPPTEGYGRPELHQGEEEYTYEVELLEGSVHRVLSFYGTADDAARRRLSDLQEAILPFYEARDRALKGP